MRVLANDCLGLPFSDPTPVSSLSPLSVPPAYSLYIRVNQSIEFHVGVQKDFGEGKLCRESCGPRRFALTVGGTKA